MLIKLFPNLIYSSPSWFWLLIYHLSYYLITILFAVLQFYLKFI